MIVNKGLHLAVEVESICIMSSRLCLVTIAALSSEGKIAAKCNRDVPVIVIGIVTKSVTKVNRG